MILSASLLGADLFRLPAELAVLEKAEKTWLHIDVMDGYFAPNLSFGPGIVKQIKKHTGLFLDVHLMVQEPELFVGQFLDAGADAVTFHVEADGTTEDKRKLLNSIRERGCLAGVALASESRKEILEPYLEAVDLALITFCPLGFGGGQREEKNAEKVLWLQKKRQEKEYRYRISVDGGMTPENSKALGADVIVSGSYLFQEDMTERLKRFQIEEKGE